MNPPVLYLVPSPLTPGGSLIETLPLHALPVVANLRHWIVEHAKTARAVLKTLEPAGYPLSAPLQALEIHPWNEHQATRHQDSEQAAAALLAPLRAGFSVGLMSEAGCPGIADPGAAIVAAAHREGFAVQPLIGPSAILLTLMGSGFNGQHFEFLGYLPSDAAQRLTKLRMLSQQVPADRATRLWIETPYRAQAMFEAALAALPANSAFCVGANLTAADGFVRTLSVAQWQAANSHQSHQSHQSSESGQSGHVGLVTGKLCVFALGVAPHERPTPLQRQR